MAACHAASKVSPPSVPSTFRADSFLEGAMRMSRGAACCLAAAGVVVFSAAAMAKDSTLVVVIGGEAYDGPPKFEVLFDGQTLGQGTVAAAIDTAKGGRFADADDKAPYVQKFTFTVPEKT